MGVMLVPAGVKHTTMLLAGEAYWKVRLISGREYSEYDLAFDVRAGGMRSVDWARDIVGSGDNARVAELTLCTRAGNATLLIGEPCVAFQLKRGTMSLFGETRILEAQIIGRVDNHETGDCTCAIWDVQQQRLYTDYTTTVHQFAAWRDGITAIGALSLPVLGVRLR